MIVPLALGIIVALLIAIAVRVDAIARVLIDMAELTKREEAAGVAAREQADTDRRIQALAGTERGKDRARG